MDDFKFACPVCGQHISCGPDKAASQMECPTCFQMLVVPHPPEGGPSKFVITASKVQTRVIPGTAPVEDGVRAKKPFPVAALVLGLVLGAAVAAGVVFREKIFKSSHNRTVIPAKSVADLSQVSSGTGNMQSAASATSSSDKGWSLDLAGAVIPDAVASGRVHGSDFVCDRSTLRAGELTLRQGKQWPPDLGMTIYLDAARGEDLAGKTVNVVSTAPKPPRIKLRWKDSQQEQRTANINSGYALRVEFGAVVDGHLAGKIYVCTPDAAKSWAAGKFNAEIRKPQN